MIFYQDEDSCLILHQDAVGEIANRMLTCIDLTSKEKWTQGQYALFNEMRLDSSKKAFSDTFLIKHDVGITLVENLVLLHLRGVGLIWFDFTTAQKL